MIAADALISAYTSGWFPMAVGPGDIRWYSPDPRGIIPLDTFHISRRLARSLRQRRFAGALRSRGSLRYARSQCSFAHLT